MSKRLAVILIEHFAEWEFGFLTSVARDYFGATVTYYTPRGAVVTAEGGLRAESDGAIKDLKATDFDALVVVGSARWSDEEAPDLIALLESADKSQRILGFICQGTLAATRAGLLDTRAHTSNDAKTPKMVATYQGAGFYIDTPRAVRDGNIVTASGSAPVSFAIEMLNALFPDRAKDIADYHASLTAEHKAD